MKDGLTEGVASEIYKLNSGQQLLLIFVLVIAAIALFFFFKKFWNIIDFITDKIRAVKRKYKS